jgi:gamma-glutamylcyclotransferase (GGCT)/AIG2-like uncharacterized protein YtfP
MNTRKKYAFYGSLRKGMYNYHALAQGLTYEKTVEVSGYKLFSLGAYPFAIKTNDESDKLVIDLFTITNDRTENSIHRMELGAGYIYDEVDVDGVSYGIYLFPNRLRDYESYTQVKGGDWCEYKSDRKEKEARINQENN